jgi:hypothetical protein
MRPSEGVASLHPRATDVGVVWSDWTKLVRPRTAAVAGAAAFAGIATDLALRHGPPTISGAILVFVAAVGLLIAARPSNPQAIALIAAAPVFGVWLVLRFSVWVLPMDVIAAGALLALGAAYARGGSILDLSLPAAVLHALRAASNTLLAPAYLFAGGRPGRRASIARGVLFALPLLIVVGALLASADAVFASALHVHWSDIVFHVFAVSLGAWTMTALVRLASVGQAPAIEITRPALGRMEWTIVLASLDVLLAGFVAARIAAMTQGGKHVIATAGLTYAQYARSGFFQLVAACVIALGALLVVRAIADRGDRAVGRFVVLSEVAVVLLLVVVVQAVQRLALYERAFGLTMPRVWATAIAVWIGLALVLLGLWIFGIGTARHWFWTAAGAGALVILLALNVVNAEALVVHRNVAHAQATGRFDSYQLKDLSDDAVPAMAGSLSRLDAQTRREVMDWLCAPAHQDHSRLSYNVSHATASAARSRVCSGGTR